MSSTMNLRPTRGPVRVAVAMLLVGVMMSGLQPLTDSVISCRQLCFLSQRPMKCCEAERSPSYQSVYTTAVSKKMPPCARK